MGEERTRARAFRIGVGDLHINYPLSRPAIARFGFYLGVIVLDNLFSRSYIEAQTEVLNPLQEKQLDAFLQMNQLPITLATATLGALGFIVEPGAKAALA